MHTFMELDREMFSLVIFPLPLTHEGQLSVVRALNTVPPTPYTHTSFRKMQCSKEMVIEIICNIVN